MAVPALASHTVKIDSRVTLPPPQKNPFYGRVKSSKHACEVHRLVKVYRVMPGRDHVADEGTRRTGPTSAASGGTASSYSAKATSTRRWCAVRKPDASSAAKIAPQQGTFSTKADPGPWRAWLVTE